MKKKVLPKQLELVKENHYGNFYRVKSTMTVYKKIYKNYYWGRTIIELLLLPETLIFIGENYNIGKFGKCRASSAFFPAKTILKKVQPEGFSSYVHNFKYVPETMLFPSKKFSQQLEQCTSGIHFFLTKREAQQYCL